MAAEVVANPSTYRPENIPTSPGVYRFYDERDKVIYVGKAKNLRARLSSYFQSTLDEKVKSMVWEASRVDWTIVGNEIESLQLEFTWIQQERPKYNVIFRDDKSFPYLAVTVKEEVPRVFVTRTIRKDGTKYFGPYPHAWALRELVDILQNVFPLRSCTSGVYARAERSNRACLLGYIGKCVAPCIARDEGSRSDYRALVNSLVSFMSYNGRWWALLKRRILKGRQNFATRLMPWRKSRRVTQLRYRLMLPLIFSPSSGKS
jgi:excinuclease ABC subunit C